MSASYQVKVVLEKLRGAIRVESEPTIGPRAAEKERPGAPVSPSPGTCRREALGAQPPDRMDDPPSRSSLLQSTYKRLCVLPSYKSHVPVFT